MEGRYADSAEYLSGGRVCLRPTSEFSTCCITIAGTIMVDSGSVPGDLDRAEAQMALWGISLEKVDYLFSDPQPTTTHIGNAAAIRKRGAFVIAGPGDADGIEQSDARTIPYAAGFPSAGLQGGQSGRGRRYHRGLRIPVRGHPRAGPHQTDASIYRFEHTGKTIWLAGDVLFCGNTYYQPELGWQGGEEFDKPTYIRTLKRLSTLHVDCILSGHHIPYLREGSRLVGSRVREGADRMAVGTGRQKAFATKGTKTQKGLPGRKRRFRIILRKP